MDEKEIKAYKNTLPKGDTIEALMSKGKPSEPLIEARLKLSKKDKANYQSWIKSPAKAASDRDPIAYEELTGVGYESTLHELIGVIHIKLPYGYGGPCPNSTGSMQYVRFYVDLTGDGTFLDPMEDQGCGICHTFDPENQNRLPIEYGISRRMILLPKVMDALEKKCEARRMKAILSWNIMPPGGDPNWMPFWGNVLNTWIRFHR